MKERCWNIKQTFVNINKVDGEDEKFSQHILQQCNYYRDKFEPISKTKLAFSSQKNRTRMLNDELIGKVEKFTIYCKQGILGGGFLSTTFVLAFNVSNAISSQSK